MRESNNQITAADARAALASITVANNITANSVRPPLWLILLCAIALGVKTAAMGVMINDSLWNSIQWGSYVVCCFSIVSWIIALRIKGITVKITDITITKKGIISALVICALLILSRVVYLQTESLLFPCIAGVLNTLILTYCFHFGRPLDAKGIDVKATDTKEKVGDDE